MAKKTTFIFIIIIAVIVWMLLQNNQDKIKPIQLISQQISNTTELPANKTKLKTKAIHVKLSNKIDEAIIQPTDNKLKELTYMQLYEKYLVAMDCFGFYILTDNIDYGLEDNTKKTEIDYMAMH